MTRAARKSRRVPVVGATGRLGVAKLAQMSASLARESTGSRPAPFVCADLTYRDAVERIVEELRAAIPIPADTRPFEHHVAYLTAKGAIRTGLRALAVELAPDVRVNVVELGIVADPKADADPLRQHRLATRSQLGRSGTPAKVVHVVEALLDATWATGETWGIGR